MFNKKIGLILIVLAFMLSISAVSAAADDNSTDDMLAGEVEEEPPSGNISNLPTDDYVATPDNSEISDKSPDYSLSGEDVKMYYNGHADYVVSLHRGTHPVVNELITIKIGGVIYNKTTGSSGKVAIPLDSSKVGSYKVYASFSNLTIKNTIKVLPLVVGKDLVKTYNSNAKYVAKFFNTDGTLLKNTKVKFKINGKIYTKKTNANGIARLEIGLKAGKYVVYAIHPDKYTIKNKITVKRSIVSGNLNKRYLSSKNFHAKFYGKNGKVLVNKYIKFYYRGNYFHVKTNKYGNAALKIISPVGERKIVTINPITGEKVKNTIKVSPTIDAKSKTVFTGSTSKFSVTLYKNEKLAKNTKMYIYVDGARKVVKTNSNGVATVNFKLDKGVYYFRSVDLDTGCEVVTKVQVKLASIKTTDMYAMANNTSEFMATLLGQNGKVAKNTYMQISLDGKAQKIKTNSKGVAELPFKLTPGVHKVVCKDLDTGYTVTNKITVLDVGQGKRYSKYGVSEDGKTLLVIGRPSAIGEEEKYGYTFYMTELLRTCPYCGSHDIYWSIFWAGSEYADGGVFPATGRYETGSAEGNIFCKDCDCDWSIFGKNHGKVGGNLIVLSGPVKSSKEAAYLLKSGNYVKA